MLLRSLANLEVLLPMTQVKKGYMPVLCPADLCRIPMKFNGLVWLESRGNQRSIRFEYCHWPTPIVVRPGRGKEGNEIGTFMSERLAERRCTTRVGWNLSRCAPMMITSSLSNMPLILAMIEACPHEWGNSLIEIASRSFGGAYSVVIY